MAVVTAPVTVERPRSRDRYGLFSVAEIDESVDPHAFLGGVQYIVGNCGDAVGYAVNCAPALASKTFTNEPSFNTANPFVVYAGRLCGPVGFTEAESQRLVFEKLKANEQAVVENVFSRQLFGQSPGLSNNPDVVTVAAVAGTNFADQLGRLEAAFYAAYGYAGIIHAPVRSGMHMAEQHLLTPDAEHPLPGNQRVWRTAIGSAVSIGNYAGNSPVDAAPAAGHEWIYITPPVKIWRQSDAQVFVSPIEGSLNRTTNQETWLAERSYVMGFECNTIFAIDATMPTQTTT